jgi:hypothetical protein
MVWVLNGQKNYVRAARRSRPVLSMRWRTGLSTVCGAERLNGKGVGS